MRQGAVEAAGNDLGSGSHGGVSLKKKWLRGRAGRRQDRLPHFLSQLHGSTRAQEKEAFGGWRKGR